MTNKMISSLSVLIVLIAFLAGCSKKSEYVNVIPADASSLVSIDVKSLIEKAGLTDKANKESKQKILNSLKSELNAASFEQLNKVVDNPEESGIDLKSPLYIFTSTDFPYGAVVAKIKSTSDLQSSLDAMVKEQMCEPVEKADNYSFTTLDGSLLAFNESTLIIANTGYDLQLDAAKESVSKSFNQSADNSVSKTEAFKKMTKQNSDANFFASLKAIPGKYRQQLSLGLSTEINPDDIKLIGGLNFDKGKITLKTEYYTENEAVKALLKKQQESFTKTNNTFIKYFPESTLFFINAGVNGEKFYTLLSENQEFRNSVSIAKADEVKDLFNSFNGDISIGLINVTMDKAPSFLAYAEVKNGNMLDLIYKNQKTLGLKGSEEIIQLTKTDYVYKSFLVNVFFGVKGKHMYVTNDELLYKNIDKTVDNSIDKAPYGSDIKGNSLFMALNTTAILDLPAVKLLVGFGGEEAKTYAELASKVSYVSLSSNGDSNQVNMILTDKTTNSLKQIVDFVKLFAGI